MVFWVGDLNFRVNVKSQEEALNLIDEKKIDILFTKDQLSNEKQKGNIFKEYSEGKILFWPTYKYTTGTNEFDK